MQRQEVRNVLKDLADTCQIMAVGVDIQRWVVAEFASAWCVVVGGKLVSPRPWTMPTGEICPSTVRWMAESVLMAAVAAPGITVKEICFRTEFALQAAAVLDLITILEEAGCLEVVEETFENMNLPSPFLEDRREITVVTYVNPAPDCVERFARIFGDVPLLPAMLGKTEADKDDAVCAATGPKESAGGDVIEMKVTLPVVQRAA